MARSVRQSIKSALWDASLYRINAVRTGVLMVFLITALLPGFGMGARDVSGQNPQSSFAFLGISINARTDKAGDDTAIPLCSHILPKEDAALALGGSGNHRTVPHHGEPCNGCCALCGAFAHGLIAPQDVFWRFFSSPRTVIAAFPLALLPRVRRLASFEPRGPPTLSED